MMIDRKRIIQSAVVLWRRLLRTPRRYTIIAPVCLAFLCILVSYFWPQTVALAYVQKTCFSHFTLAPSIYRQTSTAYTLEPSHPIKVGAVTLASTQLCVTPKIAPDAGTNTVAWSPFGLPLGQRIIVQASAHPKASLQLLDQAVPATKSLIIPLDKSDNLFTYRLLAGDKEAACVAGDKQLACDLPALKLKQGSTYTVRLARYFNGQQVGAAAERSMMTLSATTVTGSSIPANATVYDKPKSVQLTMDKKVVHARASLRRSDRPEQAPVQVDTQVTDQGVVVTWPSELERSAPYSLVVDQLEAVDGSSLVEPYQLAFTVSGGPKVTAISIGSSNVAPGTTATITFDQALSDKQGVAGGIAVTGGATVVGRSGNRVTVSLANVPRCGTVSLRVTNDLRSQYDISGGSDWNFGTRMRCHALQTIGTSVSGRSITAYIFGDGAPQVVYTGAIHGNELSTRSLLLRWVDELEANAGRIPAGMSLAVIPSINPDGVAAGRRTNANNVDLNRNFATNDWQSDITTVNNDPFPGGGGPSPLSEPESKAIANYIAAMRPRLVVSYHSIGGLLTANQYGNSNSYAQKYSQLSGYANETGSGDTFEYSISGTADDYYGQQLGVASVLIELGSHSDPQMSRNRPAMWAMLD
jgi:predicted deacylase